MFTQVSAKLRRDVAAVKEVILWQSELRNALIHSKGLPPTISGEDSTKPALLSRPPDKIVWQMFDHYAAISRIYALFENAVFDVAEEFLQLLPSVTPNYSHLPDRLKSQHRVGVGQVLTKWSPERMEYKSLAEREIASGLADGLRDTAYKLLPLAFFLAPDNLRANAVGRLFADIGFDNAFAYVTKASAIQSFLGERFSKSETAESLLNELVQTRNEAAHGNDSELASAAKLVNYADFVVIVVDVLSALLLSRSVQFGIASGRFSEIGKIAHVYSNNIVGVKALTTGKLSLGDKLVCLSREPLVVVVESLRIEGTDMTEIEFTSGFEFGVRFDRKTVLNVSIVRCSS